MFYFHEILKKRGKFGIIWLAATVPKRLSKRDVHSVDVVNSSKDIIEVLTNYTSVSGRENVRFSLYLSSQLMFGLFSVHNMKAAILLEDVKSLFERFIVRREERPNIDLIEPSCGFRVTFGEPDLENAPIDFGSFSFSGATPIHQPSYEYFIISTPRSPDEWQISPGYPEEYRRRVTDIADELRARPEDITIHEEVIPTAEEEPIIDIPSGLPAPDFLEPPVSFFATSDDIPEIEREVPERELEVPAVSVIEPQIVTERDLPDVDDQQQGVDSFPLGSATAPLPDRSPTTGDIHALPSPRPDATRRSPPENGEQDLILGPIDVRGRRGRRGRSHRRRRHLIIDQVTSLSREQMMDNFNTANVRLVRPLDIPHIQEPAQSMLTRFGLRAAARGTKRFWRNPKTLPEPDDPSPFCKLTVDESTAPDFPGVSDLIDDVLRPSIPEEDSHGLRSREEIRAEETHDDTHGLSTMTSKTSSSLQHSRTLQDRQRQSATTTHSLNVPDIATPDIARIYDVNLYEDLLVEPVIPETMEELPNLLIEPEILEEDRRDISTTQTKDICIVSPERTPPPPSPDKPSSPHIEQAMVYVKEAFEESTIPNLITFTSLIRKTPRTRKYVAKLFSVLLDFHASSVVSVQQEEPFGEIYISKGPNFYAFA